MTTPDLERAALKACETLIKFNVNAAPVIPIPILKRMPGVVCLSFAEMAVRTGTDRDDVIRMFGSGSQDAVTSLKKIDGKIRYVVAYNQRLPFYMLQRALARELGHIVLGHDGSRPDDVRMEEAIMFASHFLCPRPLIMSLRAAGITVTVETLGNVTGCYERCLAGMRITPGIFVPPELNRMIKEQFSDYVRNFVDCQAVLSGVDTSPVADFGTFMDNYEE